MIVTIFRNRLRTDHLEQYREWAERMDAFARAMPGYISHKRFDAEDGERVTIIEFESAEAQLAWRRHPEHVKAQRLGRELFYSEFDLKVCEIKHESKFKQTHR